MKSTQSSSLNYPPSPPSGQLDELDGANDDDFSVAANATISKPLTLANVAAIPSSFSTISTTPTSDLDDASSDSERSSFSSESSAVSSPALSDLADSPLASPVHARESRLLGKLFGQSYASQLAMHAVAASVVILTGASKRSQAVVLASEAHDMRTLYFMPSASEIAKLDSARLIELMELADEQHDCNGLVICLEKKNELLAETIHALCFVGGSIVHPDAGAISFDSQNFVLVGLDL